MRKLLRLLAIEPTERALWCFCGVGALGLLSIALPFLNDAAPVFFVGLLGALVVDFVLAGDPARLDVKRKFALRWHQGEPGDVEYQVRVRPDARLLGGRCQVHLADTLPESARTIEEEAPIVQKSFPLEEQAEASFRSEAKLYERGRWPFGRLAVRTEGPLRLVRRRERRQLASEDAIEVVPNLSRIGAQAQRLLRGQDAEGARRRRQRQQGREFESLREYVRGDDIRLIEWKASARRNQLIVKRLQPELRQDVVVMLDCGRHLLGRHDVADGGEPRLDVALSSALTLAAAALLRGDRVGFLCFSDEVRAWVPPGTGSSHLRHIGEAVGQIDARAEEANYAAAIRFLLARQKRRAMVAVVTDVVDEPSARALAGAVAQVRGRHLPVAIALGDPGTARLAQGREQLGPGPEAAAIVRASARLLDHRARGLAAVAAAGARVVDAPAPRAAALSVETYTTIKSQGRL